MDAERLLGGLLGNFLGSAAKGVVSGGSRPAQQQRRQPQPTGMLGQLGRQVGTGQGVLAALGLAFGAYEAYQASQKPGLPTGGMTLPPPMPGSGMAPPPPLRTGGVAPSPTPGAPCSAPPPLPQAQPPAARPALEVAAMPSNELVATRLIQTMIAAAHADGAMDDKERGRIVKKLKESGLGKDEERWLAQEMASPKALPELVAGVDDPGVKRLMYGLAVTAVDPDTFEELKWLGDLGRALGLAQDEIQALHQRFEGKEA